MQSAGCYSSYNKAELLLSFQLNRAPCTFFCEKAKVHLIFKFVPAANHTRKFLAFWIGSPNFKLRTQRLGVCLWKTLLGEFAAMSWPPGSGDLDGGLSQLKASLREWDLHAGSQVAGETWKGIYWGLKKAECLEIHKSHWHIVIEIGYILGTICPQWKEFRDSGWLY